MAAERIEVTVVYALPHRHWALPVQLPAGSTVADAIVRCGIEQQLPGIVVDDRHVGVFSRPCTLATELRDGDRVEIYRPLLCDPKEVRRRRAGGG